ncbi:uncharacterized protein LOC128255553 [Drosophila gunungcola]|uniref:uncharacterized protein LOC128255553 n=1 Tax=Drosophila gunungcola TaxID=103775 RepID=UPI0022E1D329|nr:uncharacterized protein LOC128255553 [Drosophila gunungcola]
MQRPLLLLLVSALLLCAAVALPVSLEQAEEDWLEQILAESPDIEEFQDLDISAGNNIKKRSVKDSSSSSEEHRDKAKDKANSSLDSSSEEKTTTENTPARKRRDTEMEYNDLAKTRRCMQIAGIRGIRPEMLNADARKFICDLVEYRRRREIAPEESTDKKANDEPELDAQAEKELDEEMARAASELLNGKDNTSIEDLDLSAGNNIKKRSVKDSSSSSEEHKDKANSSGDSSSEEKTTTESTPARKRRDSGMEFKEQADTSVCILMLESLGITTEKLNADARKSLCDLLEYRRRREIAPEESTDKKANDEPELDAQAEKELDEEMARAASELLNGKDNTSIEDYAQGCEVMEVSSKEANEATYAE